MVREMNVKRRQTGAVLVMVAILIVVLIGVAALALDVGRLLVLRTEMHNAVDAAALAAATELNGGADAQTRARHAAVSLLEHDSKFAKVREILGDTLTADEIAFEFFCAIENNTAVASNLTSECTNGLIGGEGPDANKISANDGEGAETHYVRVTLNPIVTQNNDEERYSIDLYFLPVLNTLGLGVPTEASTTAKALAGRSFTICDYPPLMICNPFEGTSDTLIKGQQVKLFMGASSPGYWAPGDFGLLEPPTGKSGAVDVSEYLASDGIGCSDPYITTKTGVQVNMVKWGLNTRFGIYEWNYKLSEEYGPAQNVVDYTRDSALVSPGATTRVGSNDWSRSAYWDNYHAGSTRPASLSDSATRFDFYTWEITNGSYPIHKDAAATAEQCVSVADKKPDVDKCDNYKILKGRPDPADHLKDINRRVITVPVLNCNAIGGVNGKEKDLWVSQEEYWKRFFITEHLYPPSSGVEIFAEYLGSAGVGDGTFHVEVKLYE
jgi:Flp pilus assembly protein TadG